MKRLNDAAEHLLKNIDESSNDYNPREPRLNYYRSISGFIKDEYLDVYFRCLKSKQEIEICFTTECKDKVRKILNEWADLITEE